MIRLIAALDSQNGIAKNGDQPWHLPRDRSHFAQLTKTYGATVLMGRRTYEIIGHPLKGRRNFVLSRQLDLRLPSLEMVDDLSAFLSNYRGDLWVIGGESVFSQTIDRANELYLTQVEADFDCDQFFPEYESHFRLVSRSRNLNENSLRFRYETWRRN